MDKQLNIFFRYFFLIILFLIILSTFFSSILSYIFTQISLFYLNFITPTILIQNILILKQQQFRYEIVSACLGLSAYILISIISFTLPLSIKKSLKLFFEMVLIFTFFNLIRILFFMTIHTIYGRAIFDKFHIIFYEGLTGILVAIIIIFFLYKNKIKKIYPILTDVNFLLKEIKNGK